MAAAAAVEVAAAAVAAAAAVEAAAAAAAVDLSLLNLAHSSQFVVMALLVKMRTITTITT